MNYNKLRISRGVPCELTDVWRTVREAHELVWRIGEVLPVQRRTGSVKYQDDVAVEREVQKVYRPVLLGVHPGGEGGRVVTLYESMVAKGSSIPAPRSDERAHVPSSFYRLHQASLAVADVDVLIDSSDDTPPVIHPLWTTERTGDVTTVLMPSGFRDLPPDLIRHDLGVAADWLGRLGRKLGVVELEAT